MSQSKKERAAARQVFVRALSEGYSITGAAHKAGVDRRTAYRWRDADPAFAKDWDEAWQSGGDWYEDQNRKQAVKGNMAAVLNGLKMHKRLVDTHELTGKDGGPVHQVIEVKVFEEATPSDDDGNQATA